jgi:hypothetical protein
MRPPVKLKPRNFRSCGRATALFASYGYGPWRLLRTRALTIGLNNAYFRSLGLPLLFKER